MNGSTNALPPAHASLSAPGTTRSAVTELGGLNDLSPTTNLSAAAIRAIHSGHETVTVIRGQTK